jgi:ubiquinone/menaquinone biosynthesis C-methylase UbiE
MPDHDLFREWDLYAHVVESNWMRHRELEAGLRAELAFSRGNRVLRVLDLGCGDGWVAHKVLSEFEIARYVGVDLSESALSRHARRGSLGRHPRPVEKELMLCDMIDAIERIDDQSFDLILASYSLHHLVAGQKQSMLDQIARVVVSAGEFFWTDVVRKETEERDDYLRRLSLEIAHGWDSISQAERDATINHIWKSDYPERESWMRDQAAARGLSMTRELFRDSFHGSWRFEKSIA